MLHLPGEPAYHGRVIQNPFPRTWKRTIKSSQHGDGVFSGDQFHSPRGNPIARERTLEVEKESTVVSIKKRGIWSNDS